MIVIKTQVVTNYELRLSQHEMETLFAIVESSITNSVYENMLVQGFAVDETVDTPHELYKAVREALFPS